MKAKIVITLLILLMILVVGTFGYLIYREQMDRTPEAIIQPTRNPIILPTMTPIVIRIPYVESTVFPVTVSQASSTPAPTPMHTIKTGPSAVLGSAFNTTRYGSSTFEAVGHHQRMTAMMIPQIVPLRNPMIVSITDVPI